MAATAATFMGKNFLDSQNSIMNSTDLTLKKMFDITSKLVGEQEEINNVDKIHWEKHSWKHLSLIGDETVINLQRAKVYVFSDSVLCLGRVHQHPEHIYHIGCAFNLHSIINNGLIPRGQNSSKRPTLFFLPIDPRDKGHQDPAKIDLNEPRRAQYLHSAWKKHQDAVFWVDINLAIQKGLTFYQTRSNAIILQGTLPAHCIPNVVRLKTGEVSFEKSY